jgi:AraC-like DNA-binding protein
MKSLEQVLWYMESHFASEITLDEIASFAGVSRFQMSRAFGTATGHSVMGFVRGRRLSVAARSLANGAPDILAVALDAGYGSHEAFTRAFRDQFGLTPEQIRSERRVDNIALLEPIVMDQTRFVKLEPPRFVDGKPLTLAGFSEHYTFETKRGIPSQWQRFGAHFGNIPGQVGMVGYGVIYNMSDDGMDLPLRRRGFRCRRAAARLHRKAHSRTEIRRVPPSRPRFGDRRHVDDHLEQVAARIGIVACRRSAGRLRALRRGVRSSDRDGRLRNLDSGRDLGAGDRPVAHMQPLGALAERRENRLVGARQKGLAAEIVE